MNLGFSSADLAFRDDVASFIAANLPAETRQAMAAHRRPTRDQMVAWHALLDTRGWAASHWPERWGGAGLSPLRRYLFNEGLHLAAAPEPHVQSIDLIGPLLIAFGSDAQKERFLPGIRRLNHWFCQGFSEPDAGSDLASLRTRAVRDGDTYIVDGQKTWTTDAHLANWMFCLVRTDPAAKKQAGISYLLVDMASPGITVRPIIAIDGRHSLNEVFLDSVRVPVENRLGEENRGWEYSRLLLANERTTIARVGVSKRYLMLARLHLADMAPEAEGRARFAVRIAALEIQVKALEITNLRFLASLNRGDGGAASGQIPSVLKLRGAELQQATSELLFDLAGPAALACDDGAGGDAAGVTANYLHLRAATIYGGTSEIQHNILARLLFGS